MFPNREWQDLKCAGDCREPGTLRANEGILWRNREVPDVRAPPPTSSSSIENSVNGKRAREVLTTMKSFHRLSQKLRTSFYQGGQRRKKCSQLKPPQKSTPTPPAPQPCPSTSTSKSCKETMKMTFSQESTTKTHSQELAKLMDQIDHIRDGINSLETWIPILDDHLIQESFASVNNTPKELISEWDMQDDDLPTALQDLEHSKWNFSRDHSRDHYRGLHVHLANMLLVPKSATSFRLNQQRNLKTSLRFSLGQWRPEFTLENRSKDYAAAEYLKRSRNPSKHAKNVRRQWKWEIFFIGELCLSCAAATQKCGDRRSGLGIWKRFGVFRKSF